MLVMMSAMLISLTAFAGSQEHDSKNDRFVNV